MAQALAGNIPVVTSDEKFGLYQRLKIIWWSIARVNIPGLNPVRARLLLQGEEHLKQPTSSLPFEPLGAALT
jgi:hypothetical protein